MIPYHRGNCPETPAHVYVHPFEYVHTLQVVETTGLLNHSPEYGYVGINMYTDDEGLIKQLPVN